MPGARGVSLPLQWPIAATVRSGPLGTPSVRVAHDDPHPARNGARARAGSAYYISRGRAPCACSARPEDAGPGFLASSAGAMLPTQLRAASRNAACRAVWSALRNRDLSLLVNGAGPRVVAPSSRRCRAISRPASALPIFAGVQCLLAVHRRVPELLLGQLPDALSVPDAELSRGDE